MSDRLAPYPNFRFLLRRQQSYVAGFSKVSGLAHSGQMVSHRAGGDSVRPHQLPGQSEHDLVVLERGVTHDVAFQQWLNLKIGAGGTLQDPRTDLTIEIRNEAGQQVGAYHLRNCWCSQYNGQPEFDSSGNALLIQSLSLQTEGWEWVANDV